MMLVTQQTLIGGYHVFSVLLELPEFEVVNQEILSTHAIQRAAFGWVWGKSPSS